MFQAVRDVWGMIRERISAVEDRSSDDETLVVGQRSRTLGVEMLEEDGSGNHWRELDELDFKHRESPTARLFHPKVKRVCDDSSLM